MKIFGISFLCLNPFFDAPDSGGGDLPTLDDVDFLAEGGEKTTEEDEAKEEKETEEKEGETKEEPDEEITEEEPEEEPEEEDTEEEDETKDEAISSDGKISVKALKEQYPDIFKKNPGLKDIIFREREYAKFGPIDDVQEAVDKADTFDNFEKSLMSGDIGTLLDAIAETDREAASTIAVNFLPEIFERSKPLFNKIVTPVIKGMIRNVYTRAQNRGDKQLGLAMQYLARELYETPDVMKATEIEDEAPDPRENKIREEREKLAQDTYQNARKDVIETVSSRIHREVMSQLTGLNDFVKEATTQRILDELDLTLVKDRAHMARLSSLWKKAKAAGYSTEAKNRIAAASLSRAKVLLPAIVSRVKAKSSGGKVTGKEKVTRKTGEREIPGQRSSNSQRRSAGKLDRNVSDYEFISQK